MRRVKAKLKSAKATHNGWEDFLKTLQIGDAFEIPGCVGKSTKYIDGRRSNIRYMAERKGIKVTTWLTPTGLWAKRVA